MILYQQVSCFQGLVNFLAANGFAIGWIAPLSTVGHQGDHSTNRLQSSVQHKITIG
jgi:hypothetical protein